MNKEVFMQTCIVCSKNLSNKDITNILFSNCKFSINGVVQGQKREIKDRTTGANKFVTYEDEKPQEALNWNYLEVTASAL